MCGIIGFSGDFDTPLLDKMNRVQSHRGPDDSGTWQDDKNGIGFGHSRLSIIDLSPAGHQPMIDASGPGVIVFNGEIYNYRELRAELEREGFKFQSSSDTEVLLKLYHRDGYDMLPKLNGIFVFALWDRQKHVLFLARDGLGVKPLYYTFTPKGFLFASELKALLLDHGVKRELNPEAIAYYLTYLWSPAPTTPFKGVYKLEPGQALVLNEKKIEKEWYFYDIPYRPENGKISFNDTAGRLQTKLRQAVSRQMVADVEVGAFLSGGLDSSAVVAMAREFISRGKLQCFTIRIKDDEFRKEGFVEDWPYAREVAGYLDVDLHRITVGPEMMEHLPKMLYHLDEPQADPAPLNLFFISQLARDHGIKVLLSGAGGDDIFSGYPRHYALLQERWWAWLPASVRFELSKLTEKIPQKRPSARRLAKAFRYAHLNDTSRMIRYFFYIAPEVLGKLFSREFQKMLGDVDIEKPLKKSLSRLPQGIGKLDAMLYLEGKHFLADHNLNYTDKMSMAAGVEVRVPLLDSDLVQFAASLPAQLKQKGRYGKWIFKKSMENILPENIINRPKTGFGVPLRYWFRTHMEPFVNEWLSMKTVKQRGIFDPVEVDRIIKLDRSGKIDAAYTLFAIMCLEGWCQIFIDGKAP